MATSSAESALLARIPTRRLDKRALLTATALLLVVVSAIFLAFPHNSLWYDEALTAYVATDSWATLWRWVTQVDIQVPFHYLVLGGWVSLAGDSEFALRLLSALCIPLTVAAVIAIGRRLTGKFAPGIAAGALIGLLPGTYWIAYEVRAYATGLALFAWATAFFVLLLERALANKPAKNLPLKMRWLMIAYVGLMLAALYTHYMAMGAFAAHVAIAGLTILWRIIRSGWRQAWTDARPLIVAVSIAGLGFAPWLPVVLTRGSSDRSFFPGESIPPGRSLEVMAGFITLGRQDQPEIATPFVIAFFALIGIGLALGLLSRRSRRAAVIAILLAAIPAAMVVILVAINPKLTGRYFWSAWIGLDLLVGLAFAVALRWRALPTLIAACLIAILPWLTGQRGKSPDSDYRGVFAHICAQGSKDDVILLRDGTLFVTAYYYGARPPCDSPRKTFGMPESAITDVTRYLTLGEMQGIMKQIAELRPPNVWVIAWQGDIMDPQALTYALLDDAGEHRLKSRLFGDVQLDQYAEIDATRLADLSTRGPLTFANWLNLTPTPGGPTLIATRLFAPQLARAGDKIVIQAWWSRGATLQPDLRVSPRLTTLDQGWTYTQQDQPPAGWKFYDDRWPADLPVLGRYELTIGSDIPPGKISVRYHVYDVQRRWQPVDIPLGEITIER